MKTTKSPESAEVTPSKKKLKQARLPFKLISEVSPAPITPPRRKRKLSASDVESAPKVGKITKENDIVEVVISDDEGNDGQTADNLGKTSNPYVKLVDMAIKKKQKAKASKKKRNSRKKTEVKENGSIEEISTVDDKVDCVLMDVDESNTNQESNVNKTLRGNGENNKINHVETETVNKSFVDIVVLEDSNSCSGFKQADSINKHNELLEDSKTQIKDDASVTETDANQSNDEKSPYSNESSQDNTESSDKKIDDSTEKAEMKTPFTPKRSARNKAKAEENNNKSSPSSKLNESVTSNPTTPKQSRSSSVTKLDESVNESAGNLTPKQLQKKLESEKKREKLEKEKQERERKRQEEKEERAKQRQEKEDLKKKEREEKEEAKRKEREEKEEQRKKEKEEKEKQKELEKKQREEKEEFKRKEKEEKEEQRKKEKEARDEEKRKRQEAMDSEKLEQEAKKKKAAEAFANFFVPKQKVEKDQTVGAINNCMLSSFTIKSDMRLAPTTRTQLSDEQAKTLEVLLKDQSVAESKLYVKSLRNGVKPLSSSKTWPLCELKDDDVILVEDELPASDGEIISCDLAPREKLRPKLFSFHENRRPPYWGTWRKKSKFVKPRRPFGQDEKQMDYEVDSDDDWEEEAEGESLDGSAAGSEDEQDNDEYEVDNEVFVPHGYLSDEEATMDEDDVLSLSPETQKARLKHLEDEFESEMKKPTEKLKPRLYGLLWESSDGGKPENCVDAIWSYFGKLSMIMNDPTPLLQPSKEPEETEKKKVKKKKSVPKDGEGEKSPKTDKKKNAKTVVEKEAKPAKTENKKNAQDAKKNQPGINMFLKKLQSS